jgi:putative transposase
VTVHPSIDPARLIEEQLVQASRGPLRNPLTVFVTTLMSAEVDAVCGDTSETQSPERTNRRKGSRARGATPGRGRWTWP